MRPTYYDDVSMQEVREPDPKPTVLTIRDQLNNFHNLVNVLQLALSDSNHVDIREMVSAAMYFYVLPEIKRIELELKKV